MSARGTTERLQAIANVVLPAKEWAGRHSLKLGLDASVIRYSQSSERRPYEVRRLDGSLVRSAAFLGDSALDRRSTELGGYVQDRWSPGDRLFVEAGFRLDWDQVLRRPLASPRVAATLSPRRWKTSKFSAGVGLYYDAANLSLLALEMDQSRMDTFYEADGTTIREGPAVTRYVAAEHTLDPSRSVNWSLGWEQQLPKSFYFRSNFIRRHGYRGWSYELDSSSPDGSGQVRILRLRSSKKDNYSYLEFSVRRIFQEKYEWMLSYARSSARSTAVLDFSLENPLFGRQGAGPLDWDAPNRLISSAFLPAPWLKKFTLAWFLEWHTGFPYSVVNESQQLVSEPNSSRFPEYFSLNLHLERRFRFFHYEWALRAGFNNITGHRNPAVVNNNIDSPDYGSFIGGQGRVFTGRIRLLGKG